MRAMAIDDMSMFPDPNATSFLLPGHLIQCDNSQDIAVYKVALKMAMANFLTHEQREALKGRYWDQKSVVEIARACSTTPSTISKRIHRAEFILKQQIGYCFEVYMTLNRVWNGR